MDIHSYLTVLIVGVILVLVLVLDLVLVLVLAVVLSCLTHTNTLWCLYILVTGSNMEWNTNSDKLILNWLANHTPPSCIQVNLISMALTINPNSEVVK